MSGFFEGFFLHKMKVLKFLFLFSGFVKVAVGRCPTFGALPQFDNEGLKKEKVSRTTKTEMKSSFSIDVFVDNTNDVDHHFSNMVFV